MSEPSIIIEGGSLEMVPLDRWVIPRGVVEDFSGSYGVVSILSEVNRDGPEIGKIRLPPVLVVVDACRSWVEAAQNRGSAGAAHWSRTVSIGECGATGCEAVQIGSVHLSRIASKESHPVVKVIDGQKKNVRAGLCG